MTHAKALLLYGCAGTGKGLLARAIAQDTGAAYFNLSPLNTDTKFPGKDIGLLLHMVCSPSLCIVFRQGDSAHNVCRPRGIDFLLRISEKLKIVTNNFIVVRDA